MYQALFHSYVPMPYHFLLEASYEWRDSIPIFMARMQRPEDWGLPVEELAVLSGCPSAHL